MPWEVEFIDDALRDLRKLDAYNRKLVLKAVSKPAASAGRRGQAARPPRHGESERLL